MNGENEKSEKPEIFITFNIGFVVRIYMYLYLKDIFTLIDEINRETISVQLSTKTGSRVKKKECEMHVFLVSYH